MCPHVSMCPLVANGFIHTYKLRHWLLIVSSCVPVCPCAPMWPMVWDTGITFNAYHTLCTHVSVCAHVPPCGQWFHKYLETQTMVVDCELVCPCVFMCPNVANGLRNSYNLQCLSYIVHSRVCMYLHASMWPMVLYILIDSGTGCWLCTHVSVCSHVPPWGQWFDTYL